ncbi:MAG: DNA (cytosine-5-)-methyltransferase [Eubacterium sp.]|jgi:DNA (cytosine-5)-methyltransferase 1|nr:DNA (cytosine-5-)-methyltransferase [Eubacterium sp.]
MRNKVLILGENAVKKLVKEYKKERDITQEKLPSTIKFIDLFCGIGGFRYASQQAFEKLGVMGQCMFSSDIDKYAAESYEANFEEKPVGDITKVDEKDIPDFDLLFAGFPCQAFSICGLQRGFADNTKGTLFFDIARIIKEKQPKAFVLENVKNLVGHDGGRTFRTIIHVLREELGYYVDYKVLNALDFGLPQKRERIIIVGAKTSFDMDWNFDIENVKTLKDILEDKVDRKHYASEEIVKKRKKMHTAQTEPAIWHENKSGNISSYPYSCALRAGASHNYLLVDGKRRLTPREMLRLQGFPDEFKIVVSDAQTRKQAGNAIPVSMVAKVIEKFIPLVFFQG